MKPDTILFDTETGGLEPMHSLLEAYFVTLSEDLQPLEELHLFIKPNPGEPYIVTAGALQVNKIDLVTHDTNAITRNDARAKLMDFLARAHSQAGKKLMPMGHNVPFDIGFVQRHLMSKAEWELYCSYHLDDTVVLISALKRRGILRKNVWSLGTVAKELGVQFDASQLHGAKADAMLTLMVYRKLMEYVTKSAIPF